MAKVQVGGIRLLSILNYLGRRGKSSLYGFAFRMGYRPELFDRGVLMEQIQSGRSVLFLCHGNICRSPFAERYLESKPGGDNVTVSSAGFTAVSGRSSPRVAIEAAAKLDVDLSDHSSRIVSKEMIESHDIVFLMDIRNYLCWYQRYRTCKNNIYFLGGVSPEPSGFQFRDPFGGDVEEFESVYRDISVAIDSVFDELL